VGKRTLRVLGIEPGLAADVVWLENSQLQRVCVKVAAGLSRPTPQPDRAVPPCAPPPGFKGFTLRRFELRPGEVKAAMMAQWTGATVGDASIVEVSSSDANHLMLSARALGTTTVTVCALPDS